jgi:hypothetical protein
MFGWNRKRAISTLARGKRATLQIEQLETRDVPSAAAAHHLSPHLDTRVLFKEDAELFHLPGVEDTTRLSDSVTSAALSSTSGALSTNVPEAEEHIAVGPTASTSNILVAAISDFSLGGWNTTYYAVSTDGGATWSKKSFVPFDSQGNLTTSDGNLWYANSDPVVAINTSGTAYLADLYLVNPNASLDNNANGLYVSVLNTSTGVISGTYAAVPPQTNPNTTINYDKEWIAVDNSSGANAGQVYVTYTKFTSTSDAIFITTPLDKNNLGGSWTTPTQINLPTQNGAVQGSQVAVDNNGNIYVAYEVFYTGGQRQIFITKGTYNATTHTFSFSTPKAATPVFKELNFNSSYRKDSFPALAIDPGNGNVYLTYSATESGSKGAQVKLVYSTNGGSTFSAPVTVNSISSGHQFFPAIAVDASTHAIWVSWFDTSGTPSNNYYNIYATKITLSGSTLTIAPQSKVNSGSAYNAGSIFTGGFIGDYAGIAAANGAAHPVWTSGGFNNGVLWTAIVK